MKIKNVIDGILRLFIVMVLILGFIKYNNTSFKPDFSSIHKSATTTGFYIGIFFIFNFVIYMTLNAIRQFRKKKIKFKLMYLFQFIFITVLIIAIKEDYSNTTNFWTLNMIIFNIFIILTGYFQIIDFWFHFIKNKNEA